MATAGPAQEPTGMLDDRDVRQRVAALDGLLEQLECLPDSDVRATALATVHGLLELYGEGLARIVQCATQLQLRPALDAFARDELVSHLLLLHGLHPLDVETRVRQALEEVRPTLESHGASAELVDIRAGVARLRLGGSCGGCSSSTATVKRAVEQALQKAAPDLERIEADDDAPAAATSFVPLLQLQAGRPAC